MGAASTEVRADSTDVLLEAAVWDAAAVSRTQRRLHLPSEAARRYERAVDPAVSVAALDRCAALLADIAGGVVAPTLTDWRGDPPRDDWTLPQIQIATDLPDRVAGVAYAPGASARRLTQIGAQVTADGDTLIVTPPSWRPDLLQPADLVEEVLRLEGLEVVPSVLPLAPAGAGLTAAQKRSRAIGKALAQSGYVEILPTPFLPADVFDLWGLPADDPRRVTTQVLNPLEADRPQLATTLLPALLEALGAQRVPWSGRCCIICARAGGAPDHRDARCRAHPRLPPPERRRNCHAGRVPASATPARGRGIGRVT